MKKIVLFSLFLCLVLTHAPAPAAATKPTAAPVQTDQEDITVPDRPEELSLVSQLREQIVAIQKMTQMMREMTLIQQQIIKGVKPDDKKRLLFKLNQMADNLDRLNRRADRMKRLIDEHR
jgi:TolA-binding protein